LTSIPAPCRAGRYSRSGEKGGHSGREPETRPAFPPPARDGALWTGRFRHHERPAPGPAGEKRPPRAGRALAGGCGPRPVLMPTQRCGRGDGPCQWNVESAFVPPGGNRKRDPRFPRPRATLPCRSVGPGTTKGQRPTRRGRSARRGRVGRWPGALAPGGRAHSVVLWQRRWPLPWQRGQAECGNTFWPIHGREPETRPAFPPPARDGALWTGRSGNSRRPAPDPARAKRPPGAGRALAGGFGPRRACSQRSALAKAMAFAMAAGAGGMRQYLLAHPRAGTGNAARFPARARRCPVDRQVQAPRKASARPGGCEAPAMGGGRALAGGGGRALAGGCGPRRSCGSRSAGPGRWPRPDRAGCTSGKLFCFPFRQPKGSAPVQNPATASAEKSLRSA